MDDDDDDDKEQSHTLLMFISNMLSMMATSLLDISDI